MKKMLKIMAMLLVIATVVFAAGCAEKSGTETEEGAEGAAEETTSTAPNVTENETNVTENATNATGDIAALSENSGEIPAEELPAEELPAEELPAEELPAEEPAPEGK